MTKKFFAHSLIFTAFALPSIALGAGQVCGKLGGHDVVVPAEYAHSKVEYEDSTGFVTCDSAIDVLEIRARPESVSRTSMSSWKTKRDDNYLITIQKKSNANTVSVKEALETIYNPANYIDGKLPQSKVKDGNGLIYIHGTPEGMPSHRTDIYIKANNSGDIQFMAYCDVDRTAQGVRGCMLGYIDVKLGLNVVVNVDAVEIGNYRAIMQSARNTIEPIFSSSITGD